MRFVGCLLALACGWNPAPVVAQVPGLYKDGVLVEAMPGLVPPAREPQEFGKVHLQNPAAAPTQDSIARANAARGCAVVVDQVRVLLERLVAEGREPGADERQQLAALREQVDAAGTHLEQTLSAGLPAAARDTELPAGASDQAMLAAAMQPEILARQNQSIDELRRSKEQYLAALDALAAGQADAATAKTLTDKLFPQAAKPLPTEPTIRPALLREAPRLTREQADALLPTKSTVPVMPADDGSPAEASGKNIQPQPKQPSGDEAGDAPLPQPAPQDAPPTPENDPPAPAPDSPPVPDDLAETPEIQFTSEIMAKATQLGGTALPIYEFVRNQIAFQPYLGSRKGAAVTLRQRAGNDTDQAALLMALLRVSGIPCRYVRGTVDMAPAQAAAWLGVDQPTVAGNILTTVGLDGINMYYNSALRAVRCTRVWVEAYVPYSNYRGIPNDATGKTWVALDPAWHGSVITQGKDVLAAMGFNTQTYLDDYISTFHAPSPLEKLRSDIQAWLDINDPGKTVADIERSFTMDRLAAGMLPGSVGGQPVAISSRFPTLEDSKRYKVRFHLHNGGSTLIDQTFNLSEIVQHKVTIDYIGATVFFSMTMDCLWL